MYGAALSPLAGYTDMTFREICAEHKALMTVTEMVSAKAIYYGDKKTETLLKKSPKENNSVVQLFGDDPDIFGQVIREKINKLDFNGIDINMGCPAPKIVKNNCGSALLDQPDLAYAIMKEAVRSSNKPVSIKIRKSIRGVDSLEIARLAQKAGISYITVHGRSREQYYEGLADWDYIKAVVDEVDIPVIGNGDISSYEDSKIKMEYSGVSAVSIGRAAIGNPFIFDEIYKKQKGLEYKEPSNKEKIEFAIQHLKRNVKDKGNKQGILEMRKQFVGYFKSMKNSKKVRNKINQSLDMEEIIDILKEYAQELEILDN
jgi:tRNA-dihydrouridine synthase B